MNVYAISDLHLSGEDTTKPMDIFGYDWADYKEEIKKDWQSKVKDGDIVLVGGDLSWAMTLEEARHDIGYLGALKGVKIIIRGNHDYWWKSISAVRAALPERMYALQNDSVKFENAVICGTRGWTVPEQKGASPEDEKIYKRELERLTLSLKNASARREEGDVLICLIHYPPFNSRLQESGFTELFKTYGVNKIVYGHLHGNSKSVNYLEKDGAQFYLTSCDKVKNKLVKIL